MWLSVEVCVSFIHSTPTNEVYGAANISHYTQPGNDAVYLIYYIMYQTVPSLRMFLRIYSDPSKIQIFLQPPKISPQPAQLKMLWPMTCGLQFLHQ